MKIIQIAIATAALSFAPAVSATVIESFETGGFGPTWVGSGATVSAAGAHDGSFGVADSNSNWYYRTDPAANISTGSTLSAWVRGGSGRMYLGFGASAAGASSFVVGFNTNQLQFQNNDSYGFSTVTQAPYTFTRNHWYLSSVTFNAGSIVGNLYDSNGTTLLASLTATGLDHGATGGVAVRSFSGVNFDTISISGATVPEPASWALMIAGFGLVGGAMRRRSVVAA